MERTVSTPKLQDHLAYPPRALRADRAAAYLDISKSLFLDLVETGLMPKPRRLRGAPRWDRLELEAAWDDLQPREGRANTMDKVLGFRRHAHRDNETED
jgi:predicted DNA-binding transcriptional regulator AlpA